MEHHRGDVGNAESSGRTKSLVRPTVKQHGMFNVVKQEKSGLIVLDLLNSSEVSHGFAVSHVFVARHFQDSREVEHLLPLVRAEGTSKVRRRHVEG